MSTPTQTSQLHRSLLRPTILHILRAAGYHGTRPSVLDTLTSITERYLLLLATTTASHAANSHSDPRPTLTDIRMALTDCGALVGSAGAGEEEWKEVMRLPVSGMGRLVDERKDGGDGRGGNERMTAEKAKRDREDVEEVTGFLDWFDGAEYAEIRRVAGFGEGDGKGVGAVGSVGVGGGKVAQDDFVQALKRRHKSGGGEARWVGSVVGVQGEGNEREVLVEGGPVGRIGEWRPAKKQKIAENAVPGEEAGVA